MNETIVTPDISVNPALMGAIWLFGLISLVCWVMEIVAAFKKEEKPLMGILSIVLCSLGGFIIGWIYSKKWGIAKVMILWTISAIIGGVLYGIMIASITGDVMNQMEIETGAPGIELDTPTIELEPPSLDDTDLLIPEP